MRSFPYFALQIRRKVSIKFKDRQQKKHEMYAFMNGVKNLSKCGCIGSFLTVGCSKEALYCHALKYQLSLTPYPYPQEVFLVKQPKQ